MGARGFPPLPKKVLELRGSWLAATRHDEPEVEPAIPDKPDWLTGEASTTWDRIVPNLYALGIIGHLDQNVIARYCKLWARWRKTEDEIAHRGMVQDGFDQNGDDTERMSKYVNIADSLIDKLLRLEATLGMTPSGRASLGLLQGRSRETPVTVSKRGRKPKQKAALSVG